MKKGHFSTVAIFCFSSTRMLALKLLICLTTFDLIRARHISAPNFHIKKYGNWEKSKTKYTHLLWLFQIIFCLLNVVFEASSTQVVLFLSLSFFNPAMWQISSSQLGRFHHVSGCRGLSAALIKPRPRHFVVPVFHPSPSFCLRLFLLADGRLWRRWDKYAGAGLPAGTFAVCVSVLLCVHVGVCECYVCEHCFERHEWEWWPLASPSKMEVVLVSVYVRVCAQAEINSACVHTHTHTHRKWDNTTNVRLTRRWNLNIYISVMRRSGKEFNC